MAATQEKINWKITSRVEKYASDADYRAGKVAEVVEKSGNLLLEEGIQELLDLLIGAAGPTAYNNANARLGVGNSNAGAAASQTGLQGGSTAFKAMDATFPSRAAQTLTFKSTFGSGDGNFAWEEWTIDNGAVRNKNLNRKVESLGTKAAGSTWTITVTVTIS